MSTETRDTAAKAIQDVIKERTCFGIGIGVIREALDTAFPITATPPNLAPAWHDVPGGAEDTVTITPGPHHTTQRLAELNEVVSALTESNNNLVDNQQIHAGAIAELERRMEALEKGADALNDRLIIYEMGPGEGEEYEEGEPGWDDTPPQPTPPADEDEGWEMVGHYALIHPATAKATVARAAELGLVPAYIATNDALPASDVADIVAGWDEVGRAIQGESSFDLVDAELIDMAKAAVAKAVELGLVPTPRIEVTDEDISRVLYLTSGIASPKSIARVLRAFAQHKNAIAATGEGE